MGIVGLPNVGKSTLFNALLRSRAASAENYPFCTIDPNVGVVEVPDPRLHVLAGIVRPARIVPTTIEFVDIAGLVAGASKGEGLGNQFLSHIREVDAILHVVRVFPGERVVHMAGSVDPQRDIAIVETELTLADLEVIERRFVRVKGAAQAGEAEAEREFTVLQAVRDALRAGQRAAEVPSTPEQERILRSYQLLTRKPRLFALNVSEEQWRNLTQEEVHALIGQGGPVIIFSAKLEEDLIDLSLEEAAQFLRELGVSASGLDQLIHVSYDLLGLLTFFTAGPKEVRAWTVRRGATAPEAAGVIHSDFQKGFISSETIAYDDFVRCGGEVAAKERGKMRMEGKEYVVQDGDVMHVRFHV
jgi:GTP-binding protein YchF